MSVHPLREARDRRASRQERHAKQRDAFVLAVIGIAFYALWMAPYMPEYSHYELWPALAKEAAVWVMWGLAFTALGYWLKSFWP